jgi:broad specificity phosphatase PhoE
MYCRVPDPDIALTERGHQQASEAGTNLRSLIETDQKPGSYQLMVYTSPYRRTKQTCADILAQFPRECVLGVREEPQLREQDFGNFQDAQTKQREKAERNAYGRFFYRFPNGESGSDVYDRLTVFEDHLVRDIDAGRFPESCNLIIVTHGLSLRIVLARWLHWTVSEYESVFNPPNCAPIVLERTAAAGGDEEQCVVDGACDPSGQHHTKNLYSLTRPSMALLGADDRMLELKSMLIPERAWERTLSGIFGDSECEIGSHSGGN